MSPTTPTINRRLWYRGKGGEHSKLLRESDGMMCCLGFLARRCGVTKKAMAGLCEPEQLENVDRGRLPGPTEDDWNDFVRTNDSVAITEEQREEKLTALFRDELGIEVRFVGIGETGD